MDGRGQALTAGPRASGRRRGLLLAGVLGVLLVVVLLVRDTGLSTCGRGSPAPPPAAVSPRPWSGVDSPQVRDLHFAALDRRRSADDDPPAEVVPADVRRSARTVGEVAGATFYLAGGPGFACLGAAGLRTDDTSSPGTSSVCLLDTSVANQGLTLTVTPRESSEDLLVVAVPDGSELVAGPGAVRLATYPNLAVLRPSTGPVQLQAPGQVPVPLRTGLGTTSTSSSC